MSEAAKPPLARIFGFFVLLTLAVSLTSPQGSVASIPVQFLLKDHLRLSPEAQSRFRPVHRNPALLLISVRLHDRLASNGVRDRSYFLVFAPLTALVYVGLAFFHNSIWELGAGLLLATFIYRMLAPAVAAPQATVGNALRVTSRLSATIKLTGYVLAACMAKLTLLLKTHLDQQVIFLALGVCSLGLLYFAWNEPREVQKADEVSTRPPSNFYRDLISLLGHRTIWPAVLIYLLWEFAPTSGTPLLNHLTNTVHLTDDQYGTYRMIQTLSFLPGALAYGLLAKHVQPKKLLFWSMAIGVPQMLPFIWISSWQTAFAAGVWYGIVGGMASAAVLDVLLRSCPPGFEGFTVELGVTGFYLADRLGDWGGSILYQQGGFVLTNWVGTAVYALILPLLMLVPRSVLERREA